MTDPAPRRIARRSRIPQQRNAVSKRMLDPNVRALERPEWPTRLRIAQRMARPIAVSNSSRKRPKSVARQVRWNESHLYLAEIRADFIVRLRECTGDSSGPQIDSLRSRPVVYVHGNVTKKNSCYQKRIVVALHLEPA